MPKQNKYLPTPPDSDDKGKEDRMLLSLPSVVNSGVGNNTVDAAAASPVVAGQTTSATEGIASVPAKSAAASASSMGVRTSRVPEGPELYPPSEPLPVHSDDAKKPPKGASDAARPPQAPADEFCRCQETKSTGTRLGRVVSVRTVEMSFDDESQSVVTETTDVETREITVEVTMYPSGMDSEGDKAVDRPSQHALGTGSHIARAPLRRSTLRLQEKHHATIASPKADRKKPCGRFSLPSLQPSGLIKSSG